MSPLESLLHLLDIILHGWKSVLHHEVEPLFINAKKIKVECTLIQSQSTVFSSSQAMAQRKETPLCFRNASVAFVLCLELAE
jgi:hypothetical protein